MSLESLLPDFLRRTGGETEPDEGDLHECRHCGSKFDEAIDRCPVCDAAEIATYEFASHSPEEETR